MTVLDCTRIKITYDYKNEIKEAILNNDPIEDKLNVIIVVSNPCLYKRRYKLAKDFINRIKNEKNVELYVVELAYGTEKFMITSNTNKKHLQLRTEIPLWHKENMINLGIKKLLPHDWKAVAWIDADIEFESTTWITDTLKVLNGSKDIIQLFSHCMDMDQDENILNLFQSFGFQYVRKKKYFPKGLNYWHPGFAWACTRKAYEKIGGLYQYGILGSGDFNMALSLVDNGINSIHHDTTENYKKSILDFENKIKTLRLGYVPGVIKHHFHGSKKNRKYKERWEVLVNNKYDPYNHITTDANGIIIPSKLFPEKLKTDILDYFNNRNEDEFF